MTGTADRSDRSEQPVRPVETEIEQKAEAEAPTSATRTTEVPEAPPAPEDEELVDYEASPERNNMEINVVHFSEDYLSISEEEAAHLDFGPVMPYFRSPKI